MRILFLSGWFPYPPDNGSKLRVYNLLRELARTHEITLLSFVDPRERPPQTAELRRLCSAVHVVPWKPYHPRSRRALLGMLSRTPRSVVDSFSPHMAGLLERLLAAASYDLIVASSLRTATYAPHFAARPALFEEVELGTLHDQFARASSAWTRCRYGLTWWKHRRYLAGLLAHFRACTVVSEPERRLLAAVTHGETTIEIIPNSINLDDYARWDRVSAPDTVIFTGSLTYTANYDAIAWFVRHVYPIVQARHPRVRLVVTGDTGARALPPASNVTTTGLVDDVRPFIASARVSVAPIHVGGGTRLKILEAMALGTPVVATPKGAEGLAVVHDEHLLLADTPDTFAEQVVRLLTDDALCDRLACNARRLVEARYDSRATGRRFEQLARRIAGGGTGGALRECNT